MASPNLSLDSLSSPSPSPSPPPSAQPPHSASTTHTEPPSAHPPANFRPIDTDSELSELTDDDQDASTAAEKRAASTATASSSKGQGGPTVDDDDDPPTSHSGGVLHSNRMRGSIGMRGYVTRTAAGRKKRSSIVPAPMWGWVPEKTSTSAAVVEEEEEEMSGPLGPWKKKRKKRTKKRRTKTRLGMTMMPTTTAKTLAKQRTTHTSAAHSVLIAGRARLSPNAWHPIHRSLLRLVALLQQDSPGRLLSGIRENTKKTAKTRIPWISTPNPKGDLANPPLASAFRRNTRMAKTGLSSMVRRTRALPLAAPNIPHQRERGLFVLVVLLQPHEGGRKVTSATAVAQMSQSPLGRKMATRAMSKNLAMRPPAPPRTMKTTQTRKSISPSLPIQPHRYPFPSSPIPNLSSLQRPPTPQPRSVHLPLSPTQSIRLFRPRERWPLSTPPLRRRPSWPGPPY
ncbi:hypothetical protein BJ912DRAFT_461570 [Pholiota molesta]|nr:hypothetical protein BJ912DRAFT_461570 [Pholiota molesta]